MKSTLILNAFFVYPLLTTLLLFSFSYVLLVRYGILVTTLIAVIDLHLCVLKIGEESHRKIYKSWLVTRSAVFWLFAI